MKTSYLDYYKLIIDRVSFDDQLVRKEYTKAINVLNTEEINKLNQWMALRGLLLPARLAFVEN